MIIAPRFNGPPASGNGGYSAGLFASEFPPTLLVSATGAGDAPDAAAGDALDTAVEVTLRRPPPLETKLTVRVDAGQNAPVLRVFDREELIAEARASAVGEDEIVPGVAFEEATTVSRSYAGFSSHPFPTCFVCGPLRAAGDGLRLFPGRLPDGRTAAPFLVPAEISPVLMWAALDCPGGWSVPLVDRPFVLGRLAARIDALPAPGDECVVMGHMIGEDGRKAFVRTTLYSPTGALLARARATWVAL